MSPSTGKETVRAVVLVFLLMVSVVGHSSIAAATGPEEEDVVDVPKIDGDVGVWKMAGLSLRADMESADMTVENAKWVGSYDSPETSLKRDKIGVYDPGSKVTFDFDAGEVGKESNFAGEGVRVIRAHVRESGDGSVPSSQTEALELLSENKVNENVYFSEVEGEGFSLDEHGAATFIDTPEKSGHYFYFVTYPGSFTIEDGGNLSPPPSGESETILGIEHVAVRKGTGTVDHDDSVEAGDAATFSTKPKGVSGDEVRQAVILYDEGTYASSIFGVELTGELDENFDASKQSTLSSEVDEVNGVASVDSEIEGAGVTHPGGTVARSAGLESLLSFVSSQAGVDSPSYEDRSENTNVVLDASLTALQGPNQKTDVQVETFGNWSTGEYRWVYVAVGENSRDMVTQTGTMQVTDGGDDKDGKDGDGNDTDESDPDDSDPDDSDGSPGLGGGGAPTDPGEDTETESDGGDDDTPTDEPEPSSVEVTDASLGASEITAGESVDVFVTLDNSGEKDGTKTVRIRANGEVVATQEVTVGAGETVSETIAVTFDEAGTYDISANDASAGTLTVTEQGTTENSPGGAEPPADDSGLPLVAIGVVAVLAGIAGALFYFRIK